MPGKMHMNCGMGIADSFDQLRTPRDLLVKFQDFSLFQSSSVLRVVVVMSPGPFGPSAVDIQSCNVVEFRLRTNGSEVNT